MKPKLNLSSARLFCAVALGIGSSFSLAAEAERGHSCPQQLPNAGPVSNTTAPAKTSIPWSQLGTKAGVDYQGDGLAVSRTAEDVRLRCVFQRLEGEVNADGLWLTSTVTNGVNERFCVK